MGVLVETAPETSQPEAEELRPFPAPIEIAALFALHGLRPVRGETLHRQADGTVDGACALGVMLYDSDPALVRRQTLNAFADILGVLRRRFAGVDGDFLRGVAAGFDEGGAATECLCGICTQDSYRRGRVVGGETHRLVFGGTA
jgi:hypothetical protein